MSVTSALFTGVSGLQANGAAMSVIGNNISNVNTVGFKDSRTIFADLLSDNTVNSSQIGKGVQVQTVQNIFTQGSSQTSENVTDLSIQGNTFFSLQAPGVTAASPASSYLSRAGAFSVDSSNTLVNPNGYQVLGTDGKPVTFPADFSKVTKIDSTGHITYLATDGVTQEYYNGNGVAGLPITGTPGVSIAVVSVPSPGALSKVGGSLYQTTAASGAAAATPTFAAATANGTSEKILSNSLEQSNVDMANEFVNMIVTQRAYSANSKTITTTDQMTQEVLQLIR
ncbi:flagellar hook basal-body protein [Geomonas sp. Red32]|uniref:flagellar hook-basal body protein n=1 Tax=Geomonas sp. Red32 TaxID=2912856 RepID=UPI00202CB40C|nr:flagellar hook basal-body protein [Geomonas sp. Red32]MCM0081065.1 flagellar hook basal-body protein [Geomonas sp. Red32]